MKTVCCTIFLISILVIPQMGSMLAANVSTEPIHVVLLAGQSNMAGFGNYNTLSESDKQRLQAVSSRVHFSDRDEQARPLSHAVSEFNLKKRGFAEIFGPELFLGITLAEACPDKEFLFIKYAQGGTALYGAWNPEWSAEKARAVEEGEHKQNLPLFKLHCAAIEENLARLRQEGRSFRIIGLAWMQGENDAAREVAARTYEANLRKLIAAYRIQVHVPDLPFVMGQINSSYGDFPDGPEMVRSAMVKVARSDPHVYVIPTTMEPPWEDFPKHTDNVHYNSEGQKRLGTAFAKLLLPYIKID